MKILVIDLSIEKSTTIETTMQPMIGYNLPLWYSNQTIRNVCYIVGTIRDNLKTSGITTDADIIVYTE